VLQNFTVVKNEINFVLQIASDLMLLYIYLLINLYIPWVKN